MHSSCRLLVVFAVIASVFIGAGTASGAPPSEVFYLASCRMPIGTVDGELLDGDLLFREIARQAILICARDEFSLATRDAVLREPIPSDLSTAGRYDVELRHIRGEHVECKLLRNGEVLSSVQWPYQFDQEAPLYTSIVDQAHQWVGGALVATLESEGYERKPRTADAAGETDPLKSNESIESKLLTLDMFAQYAAVREAHGEIASSGESSTRLGALARGYANLAQLTEFFPSQMRMPFAARSILYGTRMIQLHPESPVGYWNRAYAYMLVGLSDHGMKDLEKARTLAAGAEDPPWVAMLPLAHEFDFEKLGELAQEPGPQQELAAFLWMRSVEFSGSTSLQLETAKKVLEIIPNCVRVTNGMNIVAGVSYGHMTTTINMPQFLSSIAANLPQTPEARELLNSPEIDLDDMRALPRLRDGLLEAGGLDKDRREPSLAVLGRLIDEQTVTMVIWRGCFLRYSLGVDSSGFLDAVAPLYEGHPHAPLIDALRLTSEQGKEPYERILAEFECPEGNLFSVYNFLCRGLPREFQFKNMTFTEYFRLLSNGHTWNHVDVMHGLTLYSSQTRLEWARWAYRYHLHSPLRRAIIVTQDWDRVKQNLERWTSENSIRHPAIAQALAKNFEADGDYDQAIRLYERSLRHSPDYDVYLSLAAIYWNHEQNPARAEEIALEFLQQEDYGLQHASISKELTYSLISIGEPERALEWAQRAASSYSAWGLLALADCYEVLGRLDEALEINRLVDEKYDDIGVYKFVARTGHGDLEAAWQEAQATLRRTNVKQSSIEFHRLQHAIITHDHPTTIQMAAEYAGESELSYFNFYVAMAADETGDHELRDKLWKAAAESPRDDLPEDSWEYCLRQLATLLLAAERGETPDMMQTFSDLVPLKHTNTYCVLNYFAGRYYQARGINELAIAHYRQAARTRFDGDAFLIDSWRRLRELGDDPGQLKPRYYGLAKFAPGGPPAHE